MSLVFGAATSDRVTINTVADLDGLTSQTWAFWVYPTTLTTNRRFLSRQSGGTIQQILLDQTDASKVHFRIPRATTLAEAKTATGNIVVNVWQYYVFTYNETDGPKIFRGTLTSPLAEVTYDTGFPVVGVGATTSVAGAGTLIANAGTNNRAFQGNIAWVGHYNTSLSLAQLQVTQFQPLARRQNGLYFYHLGFPGTGTQVDLTGLRHGGAVTGATVGNHVPLGPPFGFREFSRLYIFAAGAVGDATVTDSATLTDTATEAETLSVSDSATLTDTATETTNLSDTISLAEPSAVVDDLDSTTEGTLTDTASVDENTPVSDSASFAEAVDALLESLSVSDSATLTDTAEIPGSDATDTDSATLTDTAVAGDDFAGLVDAFTLADTSSEADAYSQSDTGAFADTAAVLDAYNVSDSATLSDNGALPTFTGAASATVTATARMAGTMTTTARNNGTTTTSSRLAGTVGIT